MFKIRYSLWGLLFLLTFSLIAQEYRVKGTTRTLRRSSWRKRPPKRQLKEDLILSPANISAAGLGNTMRDRRRRKAEEAAYGEVKKQEYSPKEKALMASLEKVHTSQRTMLQLEGRNTPLEEKMLRIIRKESKTLLPTLRKIKEFPCWLILDNPKEMVRESKRLHPNLKKGDLQYLLALQIRQKHLLKTHIENKIRARRSLK